MVGVPPIQPRGVGTASQAVVPRQMGNCTTSRHDGPELEDADGGRECIADNATAREDQATQNLDGRSPGAVSLNAANRVAGRLGLLKPASGSAYLARLHRVAEGYAAAHERVRRLIAEELWRMEQEDTLNIPAYAAPESPLDTQCHQHDIHTQHTAQHQVMQGDHPNASGQQAIGSEMA